MAVTRRRDACGWFLGVLCTSKCVRVFLTAVGSESSQSQVDGRAECYRHLGCGLARFLTQCWRMRSGLCLRGLSSRCGRQSKMEEAIFTWPSDARWPSLKCPLKCYENAPSVYHFTQNCLLRRWNCISHVHSALPCCKDLWKLHPDTLLWGKRGKLLLKRNSTCCLWIFGVY